MSVECQLIYTDTLAFVIVMLLVSAYQFEKQQAVKLTTEDLIAVFNRSCCIVHELRHNVVLSYSCRAVSIYSEARCIRQWIIRTWPLNVSERL